MAPGKKHKKPKTGHGHTHEEPHMEHQESQDIKDDETTGQDTTVDTTEEIGQQADGTEGTEHFGEDAGAYNQDGQGQEPPKDSFVHLEDSNPGNQVAIPEHQPETLPEVTEEPRFDATAQEPVEQAESHPEPAQQTHTETEKPAETTQTHDTEAHLTQTQPVTHQEDAIPLTNTDNHNTVGVNKDPIPHPPMPDPPIVAPPTSIPHTEEHHLHTKPAPTPAQPVVDRPPTTEKDIKEVELRGLHPVEGRNNKDTRPHRDNDTDTSIYWGVGFVAVAIGAVALLKWKKII